MTRDLRAMGRRLLTLVGLRPTTWVNVLIRTDAQELAIYGVPESAANRLITRLASTTPVQIRVWEDPS